MNGVVVYVAAGNDDTFRHCYQFQLDGGCTSRQFDSFRRHDIDGFDSNGVGCVGGVQNSSIHHCRLQPICNYAASSCWNWRASMVVNSIPSTLLRPVVVNGNSNIFFIAEIQIFYYSDNYQK